MHLAVYCALAALVGTLALRTNVGRVIILMACVAEPAIFWVRWLFTPNDTWATYIHNLMAQPLLLSGDIDMWALAAMYFAHLLLANPEDTGITRLGNLGAILLGPIHASFLAFMIGVQKGGRIRLRISNRLMVAGGVIQLVQLPLWLYFTIRGVTEIPAGFDADLWINDLKGTIEGLFAVFSLDLIHQHKFIMIFVLSCWFFGVVYSLRNEEGNVADTVWECSIVAAVVALIFCGNIAFAHYIVWFYLRDPTAVKKAKAA